jgi:ABC-type uncharacterized transport system auxiliary subunit
MIPSPLIRILMPALFAVGLSACLRLEREAPEKRFYLIEAVRPSASPPAGAASRTGGTLQVRRIVVGAAFESPSFVYRTGEATYDADYYHAFFVSPDAMFTDQVTRWLDAAQIFDRVGATGSQLRGEYLLEGSVRTLYGDYRSGIGPEAVLEIQLLLLRDAPDGMTTLHEGTYEARERLRGDGPEALVAAWSLGLASILERAEVDFAGALDRARTESGIGPAP